MGLLVRRLNCVQDPGFSMMARRRRSSSSGGAFPSDYPARNPSDAPEHSIRHHSSGGYVVSDNQTWSEELHQDGTNWEEALRAELGSSPLINRPYIMNPLSSLMVGFGKTQQFQVVNGFQDGTTGVSATGSLESLDCLLAVPSGDSENNGFNARKKEMRCAVNGLDGMKFETVKGQHAKRNPEDP